MQIVLQNINHATLENFNQFNLTMKFFIFPQNLFKFGQSSGGGIDPCKKMTQTQVPSIARCADVACTMCTIPIVIGYPPPRIAHRDGGPGSHTHLNC